MPENDQYFTVTCTCMSSLPFAGIYNWTGPSEYFVEVDLPASEQDAGYPEPALMHVALWLPDVPEGQTVPVIATIHPYYDFGTEVADGDSNPNTIPDGGVGAWVEEQQALTTAWRQQHTPVVSLGSYSIPLLRPCVPTVPVSS